MKNKLPLQQTRLIFLAVYILILCAINKMAFGTFIPLVGAKGLWFYTGFASLLLGDFLITPIFSKPADAISYASFAGIALYLVNDWQKWLISEKVLYCISIIFCIFILIVAFLSIITKDSQSKVVQKLSNTFRVISDIAGNQRILFSDVILFSIFVFHRTKVSEWAWILLAWVVAVVIKPEYIVVSVFERMKKIWLTEFDCDIIGTVAAYQTPGIILVRQNDAINLELGTPLIINDQHASPRITVVLDYVGIDEALLLRTCEICVDDRKNNVINELIKKMPQNSVSIVNVTSIIDPEKCSGIKILDKKSEFVGIVAPETSIETLYFEVIIEEQIEEGRLVEVEIGKCEVLYQIIDGLTKEEIVHQKNTHGYARAKAKKIGIWDEVNKKFLTAKWLPKLNTPVYLKEQVKYSPLVDAIGHFPETNYPACIKSMDHLVTHNTAVLGILGIGKSMLAIELVERMIKEKIKVVCLDLTNQYEKELFKFYNVEVEKEKISKIQEAGEKDKGAWQEEPERGGSLPNLKEAIKNEINDFMKPECDTYLKIWNPAQLSATKQITEPKSFQAQSTWQRRATLWAITPVEITKIISECILESVQNEMTDKARVCIVFEEAHSLIPEFSAVASEGDKAATNATARAILQGRKYGLGCLVITQRTASVTKTILNQCNTIFAMRTFDETGKTFLANYVGSDYTNILSSLRERQAVFFGKASSCENPVLIRLNDQDDFRNTFYEKNIESKTIDVDIPF